MSLEQEVANVVERLYGTIDKFLTAYSMNKDLVFSKIVKEMKVVPIDLKWMLWETYKHHTTQEPDQYA